LFEEKRSKKSTPKLTKPSKKTQADEKNPRDHGYVTCGFGEGNISFSLTCQNL
jgi:hypothetical protein